MLLRRKPTAGYVFIIINRPLILPAFVMVGQVLSHLHFRNDSTSYRSLVIFVCTFSTQLQQ
ncbi:hypothetical protein CWI80_02175 [Pseudidiomarina sediminum]|uniref:Uncharacterized protein n=1 Tax=Pseudidiomarina sediminum TaxID=431675 RepID=A0A432Z8H7_9GAMM|nr:hypothetical protein CWI80_02175 [Pseudidiomarina sediminum]